MRVSLQYRVAFCVIGFVIDPISNAQAPPDVSGTYSFVEIDCVRSSGESYTVTIPGYTDQFVIAGQDFNETEVFGHCTQSVRGTFAIQPSGAYNMAGIASVANGSCTDTVEVDVKTNSGQEGTTSQSRTFVDGKAVTYTGSLVVGTGTVIAIIPNSSSSGDVCSAKYQKQ